MNNPLARFAVHRNQIKIQGNIEGLFSPNSRLELSVYRVGGLQELEITQEGLCVVSRHKTAKCLYGWAIFDRSVISKVGLKIKDDSPPSLHSDIVCWPTEKHERGKIQQQIALQSQRKKLETPLYPKCKGQAQ